MNLLNRFWRDEAGLVLSAEAVLVGTVGVLGVVAGLSTISHAVEGELRDVGFAIRSLDQSYAYHGHQGCNAWTAGSYFIQPRVEDSLVDLGRQVDLDVEAARRRIDAERKGVERGLTAPDEPEKTKKKGKPNKKPNRKSGQRGPILDESSEPMPQPNDLPDADASGTL